MDIFRNHYWSCSQFAHLVYERFGINKPSFASGEEWSDWEKQTQEQHPYVYFFVETILDIAQNIIYYPADIFCTIQQSIKNRFINKTHLIDTKLPEGQFYDTDTLLLHGMFELLVDFVECEKALMSVWCNSYPQPWWMKHKITAWKRYRNSEAGLQYLEWETTLTDSSPKQANAATEIITLYNWWKNIRPNRPDPYDESGLTEYYNTHEQIDNSYTMRTVHFTDEWTTMSDQCAKIEQQYEQEDTEMMHKLINIRNFLWA